MRLQDLFEALEQPRHNTVVYAFGRFNPPNPGHRRLVNYLKRLAAKYNADWYLFISPRDPDPAKNPLTPEQKLAWWRAIDPEDADHFVMSPRIPNSSFAAEYLYNEGYDNCIVAYGAGEEAMRFPIAYNGKTTGKTGEPLTTRYAFKQFIDGGSPGAEDARGIPGNPRIRSTDLRDLVARGDRAGFYKQAGVDPRLKVDNLDYFTTLQDAMSQAK